MRADLWLNAVRSSWAREWDCAAGGAGARAHGDWLTIAGAVGLLLAFSTAARAVTATSLGSFEGMEEPRVRYAPASGAFVRDEFANIAVVGEGAFRMTLRYRSDEWDGDRDTPNRDRQRAEVKGLGPHQKLGETFVYATTWRSNPSFKGAGRFCHIFQLKSTDGDSGAPLVTVSIHEGASRASVQYWPGTAKASLTVREFPWTPDRWQTVRVRIKTSDTADGEVAASVDGDVFQGVRGVPVHRPGGRDYRPKWGLYRGVAAGLPLGDDFIEHRAISAEKEGGAAANERATRLAEEAETEPEAAMGKAERLTLDEGRTEAMVRVFNRWADRDAGAVLRWAATRAPGAELDRLLWYFATDSTLRYVEREKALAGAALISEPALRKDALEHVVLIWARREPEAAARYVRGVGALEPGQKTEILKKIEESKPAVRGTAAGK